MAILFQFNYLRICIEKRGNCPHMHFDIILSLLEKPDISNLKKKEKYACN